MILEYFWFFCSPIILSIFILKQNWELYTHAIISFPRSFLAVNHHNTKNCVPYILTKNYSPMRESFWQKNSLITHILFEIQPIIIFSPVTNFGDQSLSHKLCFRVDVTQFLLLRWFTAKNERGNDKIA